MKPQTHIVEALSSHSRSQMLDVTEYVRAAVASRGMRSGLVVVQSPHTTAAITVNENADPDVQHDLLVKLDRLAPKDESFYRHSEGNSDAHLKTSLVGVSVTLIVEEGELLLGQWQGVYFCEFDGPRRRELWIQLLPTAYYEPRDAEKV